MLDKDIIISNNYKSVDIVDKYYTMALFLIENNYPVNTQDIASLAEYLRKQDLGDNNEQHDDKM